MPTNGLRRDVNFARLSKLLKTRVRIPSRFSTNRIGRFVNVQFKLGRLRPNLIDLEDG